MSLIFQLLTMNSSLTGPESHQTDAAYSIITNSAIIAINQDSAGPVVRRWRRALPGSESSYSKVAGTPSLQLWSGRIYDNGGGMIAALLNTGEKSVQVDVKFTDIFRDEVWHPSSFSLMCS